MFLKDGLDLIHIELGLELLDVGEAGGVGSTASVGKIELVVKNLVTGVAPV